MPKNPRPTTVIMVAFATGSVTIQCRKTKAEVKAIMNVPPFLRTLRSPVGGEIQPAIYDEEPTKILLPSISETDVKEDPRSQVIQYRLTNEEIEFYRKDVVFWSVSEAVDPPMVLPVGGAIIR